MTRGQLARLQERLNRQGLERTQCAVAENIQRMIDLSPLLHSERIPVAGNRLYAAAEIPARQSRSVHETDPKWVGARNGVVSKMGTGCLLALVGNRGTGKTQIAQQAALYMTAQLQGAARYCRAMQFFLEVRDTFKKQETSELDVLKLYRAPRLLIIDELQERGETPWEDRLLSHLIDLRYGDMTDTIMVANLTPKALQDSVGNSIADRMRESGGIIECNWASFRARPQEERRIDEHAPAAQAQP